MKMWFEVLGFLLLPLLVTTTKRSTYLYDYSLDYDINTLPGEPGKDYPALAEVPPNDFYCEGKMAGYYADPNFRCQVYHKCDIDQRKDSFLCSNGTVFNQKTFVCEWWYSVDCSKSSNYYHLNSLLYKKKYSLSSSLYKDSQGVVYIHSSPIVYSDEQPDLSVSSYAKPEGDLLFATFFNNVQQLPTGYATTSEEAVKVVDDDDDDGGYQTASEDYVEDNTASEEKVVIKRYKAQPVASDGKAKVEEMDEEEEVEETEE